MSDKKAEKKRKRRLDQGDVPNKKPATERSKEKMIRVIVIANENYACPAIVDPNGITLPENISMRAYRKPRSQEHGSRTNKTAESGKSYEILLHSDAHPKLNHVASEEPSETGRDPVNHYIGIHDPRTGELQLMQATALKLTTALRKEVEEVIKQRELAEKEVRSVQSRREELGMAFGTKKAKRAIAERTINAISSQGVSSSGGPIPTNAVAEAVLDSIKDSLVDMPTRDELQSVVDDAKPRPKANASATELGDVYPIKTLVPRGVLEEIDVTDWERLLKDKEDVKTTSRYVAHRMVSLEKKTEKLKALRYVLALVDFHANLRAIKGGGRKLPKKDEMETKMEAHGFMASSIKKQFSSAGELTKWQYDYLVAHVLAIALFIDDFKVDTYDLREDLRLDTKQITQYFRELGCRVAPPSEDDRRLMKLTAAAAADHRIARLTIPLELPKQRVYRPKR